MGILNYLLYNALMKNFKTILLIGIFSLNLFSETLLKEDFNDMSAWESVKFEKIERLSTYTTSSSGLLLESQNSASALRLKGKHDIKEFPIITLKWKATLCDIFGDPQSKSGDDYPLRLYVAWEYDPSEADWSEKVLYGILKLFYGEYPPKAALNYVMSPKKIEQTSFSSPYTDKVKVIPLDSCEEHLGKWAEHRINVIDDYTKLFGNTPSGKVTLGIMADSDNTKGKSSANIAYITIHSAIAK